MMQGNRNAADARKRSSAAFPRFLIFLTFWIFLFGHLFLLVEWAHSTEISNSNMFASEIRKKMTGCTSYDRAFEGYMALGFKWQAVTLDANSNQILLFVNNARDTYVILRSNPGMTDVCRMAIGRLWDKAV